MLSGEASRSEYVVYCRSSREEASRGIGIGRKKRQGGERRSNWTDCQGRTKMQEDSQHRERKGKAFASIAFSVFFFSFLSLLLPLAPALLWLP